MKISSSERSRPPARCDALISASGADSTMRPRLIIVPMHYKTDVLTIKPGGADVPPSAGKPGEKKPAEKGKKDRDKDDDDKD